MIKSYKNKGLKELFEKGATRHIDRRFHRRCIEVLDVLNRAENLHQMDISGWRLHPLRQFKPLRYSVWVSGAWRITFEFENGEAYRVDLEQYH